jgi:hypothetical protein
MVQGKPLIPVQWDIEKYLSQAETVLAWAKANMSQEPHTKVYLLGLMYEEELSLIGTKFGSPEVPSRCRLLKRG